MENEECKRFGFYSAAHVAQSATERYDFSKQRWEKSAFTSVYKTLEGKEVTVTYVGLSPDPKQNNYKWPDAVCVGQVTKYVRQGVADMKDLFNDP